MKYRFEEKLICIVGIGYVGLPLAEAFSKSLRVVGFDTDSQKVKQLNLRKSQQPAAKASVPSLTFTANGAEIAKADFIIICVPTPVTQSKEPDLSHIEEAGRVVGQNMKRGSVVILESTVYPGVTEEILKPILEAASGLKCGEDFKVGYSPERINPGDIEHTIDRVTKVVAGMDEETTELIAQLYQRITPYIFKARDIRTTEAAKVIENIQRDLNIALMNELAVIFKKMGLDTRDVLDAAATKWNFHRYSPGLVGGHCIPVDPYYLVYKAKELGYHPQVILAGRAINDYMGKHVAEMTVKALNRAGKVIKGSRVLIMGLTYKEDVPDVRESQVQGMVKELREYEIEVLGFDPMLNADDFEDKLNIKLIEDIEEARKVKVDCVILAVAHSSFRRLSLTELKEMQNHSPILIDVRGTFDAREASEMGFYYETL